MSNVVCNVIKKEIQPRRLGFVLEFNQVEQQQKNNFIELCLLTATEIHTIA